MGPRGASEKMAIQGWNTDYRRYHQEYHDIAYDQSLAMNTQLKNELDQKDLVLKQHGRTLARLRRALEQVAHAPTLADATDIAREAIGDDND